MKTLLYANRAEPKSISVILILLLAAAGDITKLRCMHRECYIFASQNLWYYSKYSIIYIYIYGIIVSIFNTASIITLALPTSDNSNTK